MLVGEDKHLFARLHGFNKPFSRDAAAFLRDERSAAGSFERPAGRKTDPALEVLHLAYDGRGESQSRDYSDDAGIILLEPVIDHDERETVERRRNTS